MSSPNQLSFLPDDYMELKAQRRTNVICAGLFIVVITAIGSAFTLTERSLTKLEKEHAGVELQYADAAKRIVLVQAMHDKQRKMARQWELTASLLEKVPRSNLLADITNALPENVSLIDLNLDSRPRMPEIQINAQGKTPFEQRKAAIEAKNKAANAAAPANSAEPRVYDVTVKISGLADNDVQVAQFITKLNVSKIFKDVNLVVSDEFKNKDSDQKLRRFQIEMTLRRDADTTGAQSITRTAAVELNQ